MRNFKVALVAGGVLLTASLGAAAGTPNTTAAGAVSYEVGQGWVTHAIDEAAQDRWFTFREVAGRSYCIEAAIGVATYVPLDPSLTLYSDTSGTTQLAANADGTSEPPMNKGARICYASSIAQTTTSPAANALRAFKVTTPITAGSGDSGFIRVRVVESTLVTERSGSNWDYRIYNSGTASVTGSFYVPGTGKSSDITISAERRLSGSLGSVYPGGYTTSRPVYFMHNGPAAAVAGSLVKTDAQGNVTDESIFALRRD